MPARQSQPTARTPAAARAGTTRIRRPPAPPKAAAGPPRGNPLFRFAVCWSLPVALREMPQAIEFFKQEGQSILYEFLDIHCDYFVFQLELTEGNNYHYQGCISLKNRLRLASLAKQVNQWGLWGMDIRPALNHHDNVLKKYCMKEETRVAGPWRDTTVEKSKVKEVSELWNIPKTLLPWQEDLKTLLLSKGDDRRIYFVIETQGCTGKTAFCR